MLNSKVAWSIDADAYSAGKNSAKKISELNSPKLAFVYSSVVYDQKILINAIKETLPKTPIIGCTSFTGVLTPDGFISSDNGFVGIMGLSDEDMTIGVCGLAKDKDARETGKAVALKAMENAKLDVPPDYFYMVANPGEEEFYLKGISEVIGRKPFFGGSAADNAIAGDWKLFTGDAVFPEGVAVAFFWTKKPMVNKFTGAYKETDKVGIITKISGNRQLMEIDGKPALQVYADWRGMKPDQLMGMNLLAASVTNPLGVKDRLGELIAIRHPMGGNTDMSMNIGNNLAVNTAVVMMNSSVDELIESVTTTISETKDRIKNHDIGAFLFVHCGGRRAGIGDRIGEVADKMKEAAGNVPFLGVFTFGEYGFEDDGNNTCGGLMLSFTAFGK